MDVWRILRRTSVGSIGRNLKGYRVSSASVLVATHATASASPMGELGYSPWFSYIGGMIRNRIYLIESLATL